MPKWTMQSTAQQAEASAIQGRHVEAAPLCSVPGPCRLLAIFSAEVRSLDWAFLRSLTKDWSPLEGFHIMLCAMESSLLLSKLVGVEFCRLLHRLSLTDRQCNAVKEHQNTEDSSKHAVCPRRLVRQPGQNPIDYSLLKGNCLRIFLTLIHYR